ncbi:MAG: hypothetical protein JXM74_04550 [Fusobacteriaceae bacterium]|nr:hypothetical protein [Fusobacteriaceae bacterium]
MGKLIISSLSKSEDVLQFTINKVDDFFEVFREFMIGIGFDAESFSVKIFGLDINEDDVLIGKENIFEKDEIRDLIGDVNITISLIYSKLNIFITIFKRNKFENKFDNKFEDIFGKYFYVGFEK